MDERQKADFTHVHSAHIQSEKQNEEPEAFTFNISQGIRRKQKLPQSH